VQIGPQDLRHCLYARPDDETSPVRDEATLQEYRARD
jgi:hypothetical protein